MNVCLSLNGSAEKHVITMLFIRNENKLAVNLLTNIDFCFNLWTRFLILPAFRTGY